MLSSVRFICLLAILSCAQIGFSQTFTPGLTPDNFSIDGGQVAYSIPIQVPAGRGGMQPSLALEYTGGGNGLLGVGWGLSGISSIARCPATLAQDGVAHVIRYDHRDRYCLDGQRLINTTGANGAVGTRYRTELDSYASITSVGGSEGDPERFVVRTKSGQVMTYGKASNFFKGVHTTWFVSEINDTTGKNPIRFTYNSDQHVTSITYSDVSVGFRYVSRDDDIFSYILGKQKDTKRRLSSIDVRGGKRTSYKLAYKQGGHDGRSYLSSVAYCASVNVCYPPIHLGWSNMTSPKRGWESNTDYAPRVSASRDSKASRGVSFIDVNGDGLVDQLYHRFNSSTSTAKGAYLNTRQGWKRDDRFTPRFHISEKTGKDLGSRFIDVNGDGLPDQIYRRYISSDTIQKGAYINTGSGWKANSAYAPKVSLVNKDGKDLGSRFVDVNGDGLIDHVYYRSGVKKGAYINTGSGWRADNSYTPKFPIVTEDGINTGSLFMDVNGDGLVDQIAHGRVGKNAYLNTGKGWEESWGYTPRRAILDKYGKDIGTRFVDVNGDGLVDQVYKYWHKNAANVVGNYYEGAHLNTGERWEWISDERYVPKMYTAYDGVTDIGSRLIDVNGDGLVDQIKNRINSKGEHKKLAYLGTGTGWKRDDRYAPKRLIARYGVADLGALFMDINSDGFVDQLFHHYNKAGDLVDKGAYLNRAQRVALTSIRHGHGAMARSHTRIAYKQLLDSTVYTKGRSARFPNIDIVSPQYVVSDVSVDGAASHNNGTLSTRYHYTGLKVNPQQRGYLGFASITKTYPHTKKRDVTEYDQRGFPYTGNVRRVTEYYGSQKINEASYRYKVTDHSSGRRYKLNLEQSVEKSYELGNDHTPITTVVTTHSDIDGYGNIRRTVVNTKGAGETFTTVTDSRYTNDTRRWHLGRLIETTVTHRSPYGDDQQRHTAFSYDDQTGLLQSKSVQSANRETLTSTHYTYDSYGQKTKVTNKASGSRSRVNTFAFNSKGQVIKSCNTYDECETHKYNARDQRESTTSPNGITTTWYYDAWGRVVRERRADNTETNTSFHFADSGECGVLADSAYSCIVSQSSGLKPAIIQHDRLGRDVRTIRHGFDARLVYRDTDYDKHGQVARVSRDYFMGDHVHWATSEYDALGRLVRITEPGPHGSEKEIITEYQGFKTTVITGSDRLKKTTITNALGQKLRVEEEEGTYTDFSYSSDGSLLSTEVAGDSDTRVTLKYDEFGRKIAMNDPDMGRWTYRYNGFGELIGQTDAKGQTLTNTYDRLGRLVKRVEVEGTSTWSYGRKDAPLGSVGKLLSASSAGITKTYTYDSLGRPKTSKNAIAGQGNFTSETRYDNLGRVRRTDYPGSQNFYTENIYNDQGFLTQVRGLRSQAEVYDLDYLAPLIRDARAMASDYLTQAKRLRALGASYQKTLDNYNQLASQQIVRFTQGSTAGFKANTAHAYLHSRDKNISYIKVPDTFIPTYNFGVISVPRFQPATHHYKVTRDGSKQTIVKISPAVFARVESALIDRGDTVYLRNDNSLNCLCSLASTLNNNLAEHRDVLRQKASAGLNLSAEFLGHLNNTLDELASVIRLLNAQAQGYADKADQVTLLAEQTLAAADHSFSYNRTLLASAEAYDDLINDDRYITYWRALDVDASGRTSAEVYGNGIVTDYDYNQGSGQLQTIHSSLIAIDSLRHIEYQYDDVNNVTLRDDLVNDIRDTYEYDRLERLTASQSNSQQYNTVHFNSDQTVDYDELGNITYKSDVGNYRYGAGAAGPHAVTTAGSHRYRYDANGNMLSGAGRSLTWSSFNKPTLIKQGSRSAAFSYGPDRARYKKVNHRGDTSVYVGKLYERLKKSNNDTDEKHYIYAAGKLVAEHIVSSTEGRQTRYLHTDALGSIDMVSDAFANVVDRRSFDAWGKLRDLPWQDQASLNDPLYLTQLPFTNKGYTGHESVQEVDLIHMGGRMYDASLARFISADPHIQSPSLSQSYNRYSYVINNPLKYNDPSGYFFGRLFKAFGRAVRNIVRAIRPLIGAIGSAYACSVSGPACLGFAVGFSSGSTYAATGSIAQAFKSGLIAFATAQASGVVKGFSTFGQKIVGHGVVGGTASVLQGGRFGSGFISSAFAKTVSPTIEGWSQAAGPASDIVGAVGAALVGGSVSVIGGGKFTNGAQTAAIQYLFNQVSSVYGTTSKERALVKELGTRALGTINDPIPLSVNDLNTLIDGALDRAVYQLEEGWGPVNIMDSADTMLFDKQFQSLYFTVEGHSGVHLGTNINHIGVGSVGEHLGLSVHAVDQSIKGWNEMQAARYPVGSEGYRHNMAQANGLGQYWSHVGFDLNNRPPIGLRRSFGVLFE